MLSITEQLERLQGHHWHQLGACEPAVEQALAQLQARGACSAIWARQGALWTDDSVEAQGVEDRLGWLDLPRDMRFQIPRFRALALELQADGIRRALLAGMGGSSLAPEVLQSVFGVAPGMIDVVVLDSTDPAQIARIEERGDMATTVVIAASKSGTTAETRTLLEYFGAKLAAAVGQRWRRHIIVITDPGTPLAALAEREGYRACLLSPADVGGRFAALTPFGLVPAALNGIDCDRLLNAAAAMARRSDASVPDRENPAAVLGAILGACALQGRDKLTLLISPSLASFGAWVEQLVAESTGKGGVTGIIPIEGELAMDVASYGSDRLFAYVRRRGDDNEATDALAARLVEAGHPLVALPVGDPYDLGAEFFRWEFATAVAGYLLGINPFDQPDVELAKKLALQALERYQQTGQWDDAAPGLQAGGRAGGLVEGVSSFLGQARPGDYVALLAYIDRNDANVAALQRIRTIIATELGVAVTVGFGPRYLHSTGQIHKGGPNTGLFLQITADRGFDLDIPGRGYSFGDLIQSQASGDLAALRNNGRRALQVNIVGPIRDGLCEIEDAVRRALI